MTVLARVRHGLRPAATVLVLVLLAANLASTALAAKPFPMQITMRHTNSPAAIAPGGTAIATVQCLAGEKVLGGGYSIGNAFVTVADNVPTAGPPEGWEVFAHNPDVLTHYVAAWAICAAP